MATSKSAAGTAETAAADSAGREVAAARRELVGDKLTSTLNKVILAVFGMLGNIIELAILLPSLSFLSVELSIIVIVAIPTFLWLQLRQGNYIVAAAKALRGAEFVFMRSIEESLMFTVSRKVLGIGYELDKTMRSAEKNLVKKFEVLDRREASSTRQLTFFNHMLRGIVLLVGVILMQIELQDDESPWNLKMAGTCLMDGGGGGGGGRSLGADTDAAGVVQRRYRLTLGTLFAFVSSISSVQSLCLEMISCIRRFQVGKPAVKRVKGYLAAPEDPWAEHAQSLKLSDVKQKLKVKLSAAARLSSAWRDARYGGRTMTCTIVNTDRRRRIGLVLNDECVVMDVLRTGLAYEQDAVRIGDRLLSINGSRLSYGAKQAIMMLNRLGRLDITLVRQNENGSGMLPRRSCKALATGAFTSPVSMRSCTLAVSPPLIPATPRSTSPARAPVRPTVMERADGSAPRYCLSRRSDGAAGLAAGFLLGAGFLVAGCLTAGFLRFLGVSSSLTLSYSSSLSSTSDSSLSGTARLGMVALS